MTRWTLPLVVAGVVLGFTFPKVALVIVALWVAVAFGWIVLFGIGYLFGFTKTRLRSRRIDREIREILESDRGR